MRFYKYKKYLLQNNKQNALVVHSNRPGHYFDLKNLLMIKREGNWLKQNTESVLIWGSSTVNLHSGLYNCFPHKIKAKAIKSHV